MKIEQGFMDVTKLDGQFYQQVDLNGLWQFYPGKLINPQQFTGKDYLKGVTYIEVPGAWKEVNTHGTYRLILQKKKDFVHLAMKVGVIGCSGRIYINGKKIFQNGKPGISQSTSIPQWKGDVVTFYDPSDQLDIVIQVSNYYDNTSGIVSPIYIGSQMKLFNQRRNRLLVDVFLIGSLLIMGLYHLILFFFRRQDKTTLILALLCFVLCLRVLVYGEMLIFELFPRLNWSLLLKFGYTTFTLSFILATLFIYEVFPQFFPKKIFYFLVTIYSVYTIFITLTHPQLFGKFLSPFLIFTVIGGFFLLSIIFRALIHNEHGAKLLFTGFIFLFIFAIIDIIKSYLHILGFEVLPIGMFLFILTQSIKIARRINLVFITSENLTKKLTHINTSMKRFVPEEFLRFLNRNDLYDVQLGDNAEVFMTVLINDIRSFTSLSETMTPEENFRFINSYLSRIGPIIRTNNGFIDKYLGDGFRALFPGQPNDAVQAAIDLHNELKKYNEDRGHCNYEPIKMGIGIHTGKLLMGTVGEDMRMDGTVISSVVDLAFQMEQLTKSKRVNIITSEHTFNAVEDKNTYLFKSLGEIKFDENDNTLSIYEILVD
ncbi:MAG: adenylate/guanylate cyclase domain-containing protein [Spirochaetes bacterium]|nr:adenylate/guanylate cyclase domain-containing protein [Spirochaetota bacterium]